MASTIGLATFIAQHDNDRVSDPGGDGGQCVDLCNVYLAEVWDQAAVRANAVDWQRAAIAGWTWHTNTPTNAPPAGAIVVWNQNALVDVGPLGHCAIVLTADEQHLVTFDQNWDKEQVALMWVHRYAGVAGWWQHV